MFGLFRRRERDDPVSHLHDAIVAQSREPALYEAGGLPDTVEGRFESLTLHVLLVLRRLRGLPKPAEEVGQDLVDRVFAHLEIALRELGVGDFGVPKRMKKIATAFYDRTRLYDPLLASADAGALAAAIAEPLGLAPSGLGPFAAYLVASEAPLAALDLDALLLRPAFALLPGGARPTAARAEEAAS